MWVGTFFENLMKHNGKSVFKVGVHKNTGLKKAHTQEAIKNTEYKDIKNYYVLLLLVHTACVS